MSRTAQEIAKPNIILRCTVGSTVHGLALEGTDDYDEMAVCCEPPEYVIGNGRVMSQDGIMRPFEQWIYRTAEERERHTPSADQRYHGRTPPSQAGDTDLVVYSLRKWARLAAAGNPTVLILLFARPFTATIHGVKLQESAELFTSRQAGHRFLGYLRAQRERLLGRRGQMRVTREELVRKHGYDTKYAMHAVRLGYQGIEFLATGRLSLPMPEGDRKVCMEIRRGEWTLDAVAYKIELQETELKDLLLSSPLPEHPDYDAINRLLVETYAAWWRAEV